LIAGLEQFGKLAHHAVLARAGRPHDQQPRRVARARRTQRDPLRRQWKIEQVGAHGWTAAYDVLVATFRPLGNSRPQRFPVK
jgi:hypothetical protein